MASLYRGAEPPTDRPALLSDMILDAIILSILRCGVGLTRADSLLRVCGGGVWRLPSFAGSRGQGRLGLGGLSGQTLTFYLSLTVTAFTPQSQLMHNPVEPQYVLSINHGYNHEFIGV